MYSVLGASMVAILQLENNLIDFRYIKFVAFEDWIYSHACLNLDYYLLNVYFPVIFDSLIATNYSDFFLSKTWTKDFTLASHVVYCVRAPSSKLIEMKSLLRVHSFT